MDSLRSTHNTLLKERVSAIRRGLADQINRKSRLIAVKGSRGVGKTNFLLDYCRDYYPDDVSCLYVNINNLFLLQKDFIILLNVFISWEGKSFY